MGVISVEALPADPLDALRSCLVVKRSWIGSVLSVFVRLALRVPRGSRWVRRWALLVSRHGNTSRRGRGVSLPRTLRRMLS